MNGQDPVSEKSFPEQPESEKDRNSKRRNRLANKVG
jgi:hypothetical protein